MGTRRTSLGGRRLTLAAGMFSWPPRDAVSGTCMLWYTMLTLGLALGMSLLACGTLMKSVRDQSTIAREIERENVSWWC